MTILIVVVVLSLAGGGWGFSRYGAPGFGPAGLLLLVLAFLYFTGRLS
jgi:hypothetical protein